MLDIIKLFYPVFTFWFGVIVGSLLWKWRNTKYPFRWNPWCWLLNKHIWVKRVPIKVWETNLFDCKRCGRLSRQGLKGYYIL